MKLETLEKFLQLMEKMVLGVFLFIMVVGVCMLFLEIHG